MTFYEGKMESSSASSTSSESGSEVDEGTDDRAAAMNIVRKNSPVVKKRNTAYKKKQRFRYEWLQMNEAKGWLSKSTGIRGNIMPYCLPCQKNATCSKTGIKRHAKSGAHEENMKSDKARKPLTRLWGTTNESIIELKVCTFIAEHDLSLSLSDWMVRLIRFYFQKTHQWEKFGLESRRQQT